MNELPDIEIGLILGNLSKPFVGMDMCLIRPDHRGSP